MFFTFDEGISTMTGIFKTASLALAITLSAGVITLIPSWSSAQTGPNRMYTATAISQVAGQPEQSGKIVKSGVNMRLEYTRNGEKIVQIILPTMGLMYFLDPTTKTYSKIRGQAVSEESVTGYKSPCPPTPNTRCERIGQAVTSGIQAERWLISTQGQRGGPVDILWDPARRHALSEKFPDGAKMLMSFRAMETVAGRSTERWDVTVTRPGQPEIKGEWWFDPDLRVVVRQSIPGGENRRLDNLVVGPVDPALFAPPQNWKEVNASSAAPAPPQAQPANN